MTDHQRRSLGIDGLERLIAELGRRDFEVYGPQVRNGVITHDLLRSVDELPSGWTDEQSGGSYRLVHRDDGARFGYAVGPESWKPLLHPSRTKVWTMTRTADGALDVTMTEPEPPPRAFVGVKPCELAAIAKQDHVLLDGDHPDPSYRANRRDTFLVVVNCGDPADTCFCPSMGTGPATGAGHDLALTELVDGSSVRYVVDVGSDRGADVLAAIGAAPATASEIAAAEAVVAEAERRITRRLETGGLEELLDETLESEHWAAVAERCLTCANCTLVCPTCFCTDLVDVTDLAGEHSERWRVWDSCFSLDYSHLGPGPHRASAASRYRQWLTHKLGTWHAQFGESGCVGCGRCITWCPVGIDLTEEVVALRAASPERQDVPA
jgi:ferredoxin